MTDFGDVYDLFMMMAKDYRLVNLFNTSIEDFEDYLSGFLIPAITDFQNCNQSLAYTGSTFAETLTQQNIKILAMLMKKYWLSREITDITQMNLHVQDKDFKVYSESQNLLAKQKAYDSLREELSQMFVEYGLSNNTQWANWLNGVYFVP